MTSFASEDELEVVAKNCSQFDSCRNTRASMSRVPSAISCGICMNWDGIRCRINAFDNVAANLNLE